MTQSGRRRAVLRLLGANDGALTVAEVAQQLGERPTTIRFHLEALVADGLVERETQSASGPGRPPVGYRAVPTLRGDGSTDYRLLASVLVDALQQPADPGERTATLVASGRRWGSQFAQSMPADNVTGVLDELGFEPDPVTTDEQIVLRHCPFFDLATTSREIVCPVHLGLVHGAADVLEPERTVDGLEPFAAPDACVVHLSRPTP